MNNAVAQQSPQLPAESNTVSMFERLAKDPSVDVAKLEKLMELQERAIKRNSEAAYHAALAGMQCDIPSITERGEIKVDGKVRSKYALFEDINDVIKPILQQHGFAISFRTAIAGPLLTVTGILSHREGHHEETSLPLPFDSSGSKNSVQAIGSSVSYGKRYVMCALLNITSRGEDDDGRRGGGPAPVSQEQLATLDALVDEIGRDQLPAFLKYLKVESLAMLPAAAYANAVAALSKKRRAVKK